MYRLIPRRSGGLITGYRKIRSSSNPYYKEYRRLAGSRKHRRFAGRLALEGPRLVREALAAGLYPEVIFTTRRFLKEGGEKIEPVLPGETRRYLLPPSLFAAMANTETPQEIAAIFPFREPAPHTFSLKTLSLAIILDGLQDPGNMGTIIRTAAAAGVEAVYYGPGSADPYSPKALRSSAGAIFHLPPSALEDPPAQVRLLQRNGFTVAAALPRADHSFWEIDYRQKVAILIGSESSGLSQELIAAADCSIFIPQYSPLDSLNAAIAAAVIVYEARRQRSK